MIAGEWLGVPSAAWQLLTDTDNKQPNAGTLKLAKPGDLLKFLGIKSKELVTLFNCRFINAPDVPIANRVGLQKDDTCNADSSNAAVTNLPLGPDTAKFFGKMVRFIRLWRAVGWTMREVDLAIWQLSRMTIGHPGLDESGLVEITTLAQRRGDVAIPFDELLSWWNDIDTIQVKTPISPRS